MRARKLADGVAERYRIARIDDAALARFRDEAAHRTCYLLDVRSPEEFAAGHLAGSRSAPGGQLVQATDAYMATRNAQIVLIDNGRGTCGYDRVVARPDGLERCLRARRRSRRPRPGIRRRKTCDPGARPLTRRADLVCCAQGVARPRRGHGRRSGDQHRLRGGVTFPVRGSRCALVFQRASRGCRDGACWY
jgi:hypothetical protein